MKKRMRIAAILTGAMLLCSAIPAAPVSAAETTAVIPLYCWGTADGSEFQDMTLLDDKGMFAWIPHGECIGTSDNYQVFTYHYSFDREETWTDLDTGETITEMRHREGDPVYAVCPRENVLRIVLRKDIDHDEAEQKMYEILEKHYPGITEFSQTTSPETPKRYYVYQVQDGVPDLECYYDLADNSKRFPTEEAQTAGVPEIADGILHDLAKAGLITEFYTWGQTADYQEVWYTYPTAYYPTSHKWNDSYTALEDVTYDWDAVDAWVQEHHPECRFVCAALEDTELAKKLGYYDYGQDKAYYNDRNEMYAVIPPEGTTFAEHFAIAAELYEQFGLAAEWVCPASAAESPLIGQNALAVAGDVTLDCSIDVSDAVLLARFCTEDSKAVITDQGKQNADVNEDGNITLDDVTAILRKIAKLD